MKKVLFVLALIAALSGFGLARADDSSDANNESLIKYRYANDQGQRTFDEVSTYKHLSAAVRSESNVCWWDYNEWFNCKEGK